MFQYDDDQSKKTVGSILRQQRQSKKLKLEEIAKELKIRPQHLEALETDRFELLPGRLYQRSFLKTYAQFLDLDQDQILELFDEYQKTQSSLRKESREILPEGEEPSEKIIRKAPNLPLESQPTRSQAGNWLAILAGLILGIFCLIYLAKPGIKTKDYTVSDPSAVAAESLNVEMEVVDTTTFEWRLNHLLADSTPMTLRIEAKGDSWVRIVADKKTLFSGFIVPEMVIEFRAIDYFSVNLGKNEGVEIYLNGMKMDPLEKGIHHLDKTNYKSYFKDFQIPEQVPLGETPTLHIK
jgi:transcriptional regulator with XRE-family HTH domain